MNIIRAIRFFVSFLPFFRSVTFNRKPCGYEGNLQNKFWAKWPICILLGLLSATCSFADTENDQSKFIIAERQLSIDKLSSEVAKKQFYDLQSAKSQQYRALQEQGMNRNILKRSQLDFIAAQAAVEGADIALADVGEAVADTENTIRDYEKNF
jgi:hypothetical protein